MRNCKRNMTERAFSKGYYFGNSGRSKEACPHNVLLQRQSWLNGWRAGWSDRIEGNRFAGLIQSFSASLHP